MTPRRELGGPDPLLSWNKHQPPPWKGCLLQRCEPQIQFNSEDIRLTGLTFAAHKPQNIPFSEIFKLMISFDHFLFFIYFKV